jgi:hypothetical protein
VHWASSELHGHWASSELGICVGLTRRLGQKARWNVMGHSSLCLHGLETTAQIGIPDLARGPPQCGAAQWCHCVAAAGWGHGGVAGLSPHRAW